MVVHRDAPNGERGRFEDMGGELIQLIVVIEAQKLAMPPLITVVRKVELEKAVRML